ncbi:SRPBCC family protein [Leifsonia sp. Leaf264]|uniref:SRPBCC family protein n=1 Tax=Leifsonia sp. Leaf264 TaxID=1736314 RepID=UPI0006F6DAFD|nr:SRPBCC family protein [Leifsonia sp. Leaf264]KQP01177.1 hypothetical protein ASF30_00605 [Leifsonia sp. Leaf264]
MTAAIGERLLSAPLERVREVLLDPLALPHWNPAFVSVQGARAAIVGESYTLATIQGLRGTFGYTAIEPTSIGMTWSVPGMQETCSWTLQATDAGTLVTHEVNRSGPLAVALRGALSGLPGLRLDRLDQTVGAG